MAAAADTKGARTGTGSVVGDRALLLAYACTLGLSAILLFSVQPMFTQMVLPRLGGSPAAWSIAMGFFQVMLLGGYAYAHLLDRYAPAPAAVAIHVLVLLAAAISLPIGIGGAWTTPPAKGLELWVLGLFTASLGLPFFALAGNSPLLQAWFARTGHAHARDPYFLYGASNIGSLAALLAYPTLIASHATLREQSWTWTFAYAALGICVLACGALMLRWGRRTAGSAAPAGRLAARVTPNDRVRWIALAFVPSGLLVAVTAHISTDVAAVPLLWVMPLALYLLTFIITFQRRPILPHGLMLALQPTLTALLILSIFLPLDLYMPFRGGFLLLLALHLLAFFVNAMVCHGELVRSRPDASRLTEFYLCVALGGALGGLFASMVAPRLFSTVLEYPLLLVLALLARPGPWTRRNVIIAAVASTALVAIAVSPKLLFGIDIAAANPLIHGLVIGAFALLIIHSWSNASRLVGLVSASLLAGFILQPTTGKSETRRSFFGVHKVVETRSGAFRLLMHGTTLHGAQAIGIAEAKPEPRMYYHSSGRLAQVIAAMRRVGNLKRVAIVGLGAGSMACLKQGDETWAFFEIDPVVVEIAKNPQKFRFLAECTPNARMVVGDARLTLASEPDGSFDLIVIDAFSSDAIPVHLLTVEAMRLYLNKLSETGVLALHVSNRNLDLAPVLGAVAETLKLDTLHHQPQRDPELLRQLKTDAGVVVLSRDWPAFRVLTRVPGWEPMPKSALRAWTDDYADVLAPLLVRLNLRPGWASQ